MNLRHLVVPIDHLDSGRRDEMHALMTAIYDGVGRADFDHDLAGKTTAVLLLDEHGALRGFSTQQVHPYIWRGGKIWVLFSGDTVIAPECWGTQELVKGWCDVAAGMLKNSGGLPCYWFLISKGFRTYLYLPLFFRTYHPCRSAADPELHALLDHLAEERFSGRYDSASGLIHFSGSSPRLGAHLAEIPPHRGKDADVEYFLERNPAYRDGVELACLAPITLANTCGVGRRLLTRAMQ